MKKKIFSILLSLAMMVTMMPAMTLTASAAGTCTITMDLNGGTLSNGVPEGWDDIGNGKYSKAYSQNAWAYYGEEWENFKPKKDGCEFAGWIPEGYYYPTDSIYLKNDITVYAKFSAYIDVVVDPKGGTISAEPDGWVLSAEGKYIKKFLEETSSYSILDEWENVIPTYPEASGVAFIEWQAINSWYSLSTENYIIQAKIGEFVDVTFDPDGGTVLSADPSWTLSDDGKYRKKYPKGLRLYSVQEDVSSSFKIATRKGNYIFTKTFNCNSPFNVEDGTVYKPNFIQGYTLTISAPENGYILVNGEKVTDSRDFFVPSIIYISPDNGVLTIDISNYENVMEPIIIEGYGNSGYEIDSYTISGETITGYRYSIDGDKTISAIFKSGTQKYPVWVDGEQFTADNLSMKDGTVSYDPDTQILTLDEANISTEKKSVINFAKDLTINVSSDSFLSCSNFPRCAVAGVPYDDGYMNFAGSSVNLNITGDGKLSINYEDSIGWANYLSVGILASNLTLNTDIDISCGDMAGQSLYDTKYYGINAGNVTVNRSKLNIVAGNIHSSAMLDCYAIQGALIMNKADVRIIIQGSDGYRTSSYSFVSDKITLNSGRFLGKMNPEGALAILSQTAALKEIKGAQEGATSSDLQFTQASASAPLILSTKDPVNVTGFSMTKGEYEYGDTVGYNANPLVKKDTTNVTSQIDGYIYTYYKKNGDNWIDIGSQAPTDRGTYKLMVEVDDEDYYGTQELTFAITSKHTITFDANGHGTAPAAITNIIYGSKINAPTAPSCDGYTFGGWYKEASCNSEWVFNEDIVTADATLYAKWTAIEYKITINVSADGYGTVSQTSANALYGTALETSGNTLKIGDMTITATPATNTAQYTYEFDSWSNVPPTVTGDATISANFTRTVNKYDVTFDANGHGTAPESISDVAYGSTILEPTAPSCDGYTFGGWYKEAGCQNIWTFSSDAVHGDTILYAKWEKNPDPTVKTTPVSLLRAYTGGKVGKKAVKLTWNEVPGATDYVIYGSRCGYKYKKIKTVKGTKYTVKKIKGKKLKSHRTYKFYVVARKNGKKLIKSNSIHFITANTMGKYANVKSIKPKYDEMLLSIGFTEKINPKYKMYKNKKHVRKSHGTKLRYITSNPNVATVSKSGVVKAVGSGTATIYTQDIGGRYCKTKVTVE